MRGYVAVVIWWDKAIRTREMYPFKRAACCMKRDKSVAEGGDDEYLATVNTSE